MTRGDSRASTPGKKGGQQKSGWSAKIREKLRATSSDNATEGVESSDNATERVALDEDEVSLCYRRLGRILVMC